MRRNNAGYFFIAQERKGEREDAATRDKARHEKSTTICHRSEWQARLKASRGNATARVEYGVPAAAAALVTWQTDFARQHFFHSQ